MTEKFIAVAPKGKEFVFDKKRMIAVPTSSARKIADVLTKVKYRIQDNTKEVWHVYDNDFYYNDYISEEIKTFRKESLKVHPYYG